MIIEVRFRVAYVGDEKECRLNYCVPFVLAKGIFIYFKAYKED